MVANLAANRAFHFLAAITVMVCLSSPRGAVALQPGSGGRKRDVARELIGHLKDRDPDVRWAAARALAELARRRKLGNNTRRAVAGLRRALSKKQARLREWAARALGAIGPRAAPAVAELVKALSDKKFEVRYAAVRALGAIGPRAAPAASALRRAIKDRNRSVSTAAVKALAALGPRAGLTVREVHVLLQSRHSEKRLAAVNALGNLGGQGVAVLIKLLRHKEYAIRLSAIRTLARMGPQARKAAPALVLRLRDHSAYVREAAVRALVMVKVRTRRVLRALSRVLGDRSVDARVEAARALGSFTFEPTLALRALKRATRDVSREVRMAAIESLGHFGPRAAPVLATFLRSRRADAREAAATALGTIGVTVVPVVARVLNGQDLATKESFIAEAVRRQKKQISLARGLAKALGHFRPQARELAAELIGRLLPEMSGLRDRSQLVTLLKRSLKDRNRDVRAEAVRGLANAGSGSTTLLRKAMSDSSWKVRWTAIRTAWTIRPSRPKVVPILLVGFIDSHWIVRRTAREYLKLSMHRRGLRAAIRRAKNSSDPQVRKAAIRFLRRSRGHPRRARDRNELRSPPPHGV